MKALHKSFWMMALLTLIVSSFVTSGVLAQVAPSPPQVLTPNPTQLQTRNFQAGTVNDPGSSLIYLIDSGVRPLSTATGAPSVLAQMQAAPFNLTDGASAVSAYRNLVSITNTNPSSAVTVHFRYFSDMCVDLLDFLVVLTANDVLMFDPFNFVIPGTTLNTRERLFGPAKTISGVQIPVLSLSEFGSGRFLLFATASGVSNDADSNAEIRFPFGTEVDGAEESQVGTIRSLSPATRVNLNPLNASAMSFNWLVGAQAIAVKAQFNTDVASGAAAQQASFGNSAWARPAIDLAGDDVGAYPDADGPAVADGQILTGGEAESANDAVDGGGVLTGGVFNTLALRGELNSGRYNGVPAGSLATVGNLELSTAGTATANTVLANAGAIAWNVIFPFELTDGAPASPRRGAKPANQVTEWISVVDDYNGSKNGNTDRSYNLMQSRSHYQMDVYNNAESRLGVAGAQIEISPPTGRPPVGLGITVECISVGLDIQPFDTALVKTGAATGLTPDGRLRLSDLFSIGSPTDLAAIRTHLLTPAPVGDGDQSAGWIRFNRIRTRLLDQGVGTSGARTLGYDGSLYPVYFNNARFNVSFEGFGVSWWLHAVRERAGATP